MTEKMLFHSVTTLFIPICLALLPAAAFAAKGDPPKVSPRIQFECEQKAAKFTRLLGKPGNQDIYKQHLQECIEVTPTQTPDLLTTHTEAAKAPLMVNQCTEGKHLFTFNNKSAETVWLGVWDSNNDKGVSPPDDWPNWELASNDTKSWCADKHFNGRFIVRARCLTEQIDDPDNPGKKKTVYTGICAEGNCYKPPEKDGKILPVSKEGRQKIMTCNIGAEPSSLLEFNFDMNIDKDKTENGQVIPAEHPLGVTWYDVSYVDGYNLPIMVVSNDPGKCATLGNENGKATVGKLPDCPWPTTDGVCLAPLNQYKLLHPWHDFEQDYYTIAAMCVKPNVCGCGDQCTPAQKAKEIKDPCPTNFPIKHPLTGKEIPLKSSGCSPFNPGYKGNENVPRDNSALEQVVCDPLGDPNKESTVTCQNKWPDEYTEYAKRIVKVVPKAYTWQYHDNSSLTSCITKADRSFAVTIGPRPTSSKGNTFALNFNSDKASKGSIAIGTVNMGKTVWGDSTTFISGTPQQYPVRYGDKVKIINECAQCPDDSNRKKVTCMATYDEKKGLFLDDKISDFDSNCTSMSGIKWGESKNIPIGPPDNKFCGCRVKTGYFVFHQGEKFHAVISLSNEKGDVKKLSDIGSKVEVTEPYTIKETLLKDFPIVTLKVDCAKFPEKSYSNGKTVTCKARYDDATGKMTLESKQDDSGCFKAAASLTFKLDAGTYTSEADALYPGIPDEAICK